MAIVLAIVFAEVLNIFLRVANNREVFFFFSILRDDFFLPARHHNLFFLLCLNVSVGLKHFLIKCCC